MKIGELVKTNLKTIFNYCEKHDHSELERLLDKEYSKKKFNIYYPFCIEISNIDSDKQKTESKRFWTEIYWVRGKKVRVTSQWVESSRELFLLYLKSNCDVTIDCKYIKEDNVKKESDQFSSTNSRYRGNAIGYAQNFLVRNILSNLGKESFSEKDWEETKKYFSNKCAYCGCEGKLLMEHAIPINRKKLGEHKIGNIVPSCKSCNSTKSDRDYKEFLHDKDHAIKQIEMYMEDRNYIPLEDNEQLKKILNMAYEEVSDVAERYITIINELFIQE